ncbi:MAG: group II truncated hemoglobin [Deltaproteobacteria bacterium]|nr:group II truncated hemoglobin [Deltaproteobacteria bacterium]
MSDEAKTNITAYEHIGGEETLRRLVNVFYDEMDKEERAKGIRDMHAKSLKSANQKLFMFLSGWLGGPQLYWEKFGHPRLRKRHLPFAIAEEARQEWMVCMNLALDEVVDDDEVKARLSSAFDQLAAHMRNTGSLAP